MQCLYSLRSLQSLRRIVVSAHAVKENVTKITFVKPRNEKQLKYTQALQSVKPEVVVAIGAAGSGKTMLGLHEGIVKLKNQEVSKIILTRPMVSVDETLGILPGGVLEKMEPWIRPFTDVLLTHYSKSNIEKLFKEEVIELCPLATMRGRSFNNAWIMCDEAQNTTVQQMLMLLTRIGKNSKLVITGDHEQYDYGFHNNGLIDLIERLRLAENNTDWIELVHFDAKDVERHRIIPHVISLYRN
jgi:phosphate starvation-inducible PhoH-like protein